MYTSKKAQDEDMEKEQVLTLERGQDLNTPEAVIDVELQTHQDTTEETKPEERRTETPIQSDSMVDDQMLVNIQEERLVPRKVPKNASQALKDDKWKKAMEDEYKSLIDNGVWTLVYL